jgi:hypothetical protein
VTKSILYLHGVRNDDPEQSWRETLDTTLHGLGIEDVKSRSYRVIAPSYLDILEGAKIRRPRTAAGTARRSASNGIRNSSAHAYFLHLSRLERALGDRAHQPPSWMSRVPHEWFADSFMKLRFAEARGYCEHANRRRAIMRRVLEAVPKRDELIILAHSLGSVVAADLLYQLGRETRVRLLVTLGSPLGIPKLRDHLARTYRRFPFDRVGAWLNVVGSMDPITGGRGLNWVFPEVLDVYVDTGDWRSAHHASNYLDQDVVARAIRWTDEVHDTVPAPVFLPDERVPEEVLALSIGFQYALRLEQGQERGDARRRFAQARKLVADQTRDGWSHAGYVHSVLARLAFDNSAFLEGRLAPGVATQRLVAASMINPIRPYEIKISDAVRERALERLAQDLGFPASFGRCALSAEREAREAQEEDIDPLHAGIALLGILVVVAPPASPAGAATTAKALTAGTHAAMLENVVHLHALAIAKAELDIEEDEGAEWLTLSRMEAELAREVATLARLSDRKSPALLEVKKKLDSVRRALKAMRDVGLGPKELPAHTQGRKTSSVRRAGPHGSP